MHVKHFMRLAVSGSLACGRTVLGMAKKKRTAGILPKPRRNRAGVQIAKWRLHHELDQTELAEKVGLSQSTVSRIESGEVPYDEDFLTAAAKVYGCQPTDILERDPVTAKKLGPIIQDLKDLGEADLDTVRRLTTSLKNTPPNKG